jgi:molybdopterin molybdotransferase
MALLPVDEAKARIISDVLPLPAEEVPLSQTLGRVLARDVKAKRDQPPFRASAMDGYAVRLADIEKVPIRLKLVGTAHAGHAYTRTVSAGEAVRIFTGAPVPKGADTVVIQENTTAEAKTVIIDQAPRLGAHVRAQGLDFRKGDTLLKAGRILQPRDLGLAASMNAAKLHVRRKPRVAILATGDELVQPGQNPGMSQIISSNNYMLAAFVARFGGEPVDIGVVRDDLRATVRAIAKAEGADVLVTSGGASVGDRDFVQEALKKAGIDIEFWKIAIRPGKPLMFAKRGRQRILGLPGNPVSTIVCARIFLKPLIDGLLGLPEENPLCEALLDAPLKMNDNRQDYMRAGLQLDGIGRLVASPFPVQDSSMQRTMAEAGCLIVRPPYAPALEAGSVVQVLPLDF